MAVRNQSAGVKHVHDYKADPMSVVAGICQFVLNDGELHTYDGVRFCRYETCRSCPNGRIVMETERGRITLHETDDGYVEHAEPIKSGHNLELC